MKPFHWLKEYFDLTHRERNGVIVLLIIILSLIGIQYYFSWMSPPSVADFHLTDSLALVYQRGVIEKSDDTEAMPGLPEMERASGTDAILFPFDPNTLDEAGFQRLGLSARLAKTIMNYRSKGGKFFKAADLAKIYGLKTQDYNRLLPYIKIEDTRKQKDSAGFVRWSPKKEQENVLLEINSADSVALLNINGIGPAFASRIVRYRSRLGGFYKMEQLKEVYGMDSGRYEKIAKQLFIMPQSITTININTATTEDMGRHPYIGWKLANLIVQYRNQHGLYQKPEDIANILIVKKEDLPKLIPYLRVR